MDREQLVELLTPDDIMLLLEHFNAQPIKESRSDNILALTVCHETDTPKRKLYYYPKNKNFYCYTHCHSIGNVVDFTMKVLNVEFGKAFSFLLDFYGIKQGYEKSDIEKMDYSYYRQEKEEIITYNVVDEKILKRFKEKTYYEDWIKEGISPQTMSKYNILFDVGHCFTIIPHYNIQGDLIGVRRRAYLEKDLDFGKYTPLFMDNILYNHSLGGNLYGLNHAIKHIEDYRTLVLFEGEKSVMQLDTFMQGEGIGVAVCGSNLTNHHISIIINLVLQGKVDEVVIAMDKEFENIGTKQEHFYAQKIRQTFCDPLINYCKISVIWDRFNLLDYKDSPTDKGKQIFDQLFKNRITIKEKEIEI